MEIAFSLEKGRNMNRFLCLFLGCSFFLHAKGNLDEFVRESARVLRSSVYGWCSEEKALHFVDLVLDTKPDVCVEIGVCGGTSLFPVALALKSIGKGVVIGIDPWDNDESSKYYDPVDESADYSFWNMIDLKGLHETYCKIIRDNKLENQVITFVTTSEKAVPFIPPIDILYIDGGHSEDVTTLDVTLYLPKVRSGGYIWMNDVIWEQRQQGVDILEETCDFVKTIDDGNCILFKKR